MKKRIVWVVVSGLMVVILLLSACAPAPAKETAPVAPTAPVVKEAAPAVKETAPAVKEAAPVTSALPTGVQGMMSTSSLSPAVQKIETGTTPETVKVTLKKLDGTMVVKDYVKPKYGGTYTIYSASPFVFWDESFAGSWTVGQNLGYTNEEFIQADWTRGPAGTNEVDWVIGGWTSAPHMIGALAESWEFPDDTTIIFHIRKGVRYGLNPASEASRLMNGREFTADDAAWNIRRLYFDIPTSVSISTAGVSSPTDAYATDKYTLVVKTPKGQLGRTWEYVSDWTRMFPPEVVKKYGDQNAWDRVVGTGPFILTDYVNMSSTTWKRNPNYWMNDPLLPENQLPYLDTYKVLVIADISTQIAAVRTGKVDYGTANWENAKSLMKTSPQINVLEYYAVGFGLLGFRQDKNLPQNDIRVRRALLMAINQQEMIDTYYGGKGNMVVGKSLPTKEFVDVLIPVGKLPPAADGFDNNLLYTYHPDLAKKLLAEAGYPNGFKTEVVVSSENVNYIDMMLMFQEYWRKNLNVDLKLDIKEYGIWLSMYQKKTHNEGIIVGRWTGEPYSLFTLRKGSMYNWGMVDDPKMEDYYNQMAAAYFDSAKRDAIMKETNNYVVSQANYIIPPVGNVWYFWQPWVKNKDSVVALGTGNYYIGKYIWIDQELKKSMGY